jgi:hypothetical protein
LTKLVRSDVCGRRIAGDDVTIPRVRIGVVFEAGRKVLSRWDAIMLYW